VDTLTFLNLLYENATGYLTVWTKSDKTQWFKTDALDDAAEAITRLSDAGVDAYIGMGLGSTRKSKGRLKAHEVTIIPGLWFDLDLLDNEAHKQDNLPKTIEEAVQIFPIPPSIIVHSGHGLHAHWLFKEPWELETHNEWLQAVALSSGFREMLQQRAASKGWKLDTVSDLSRVLRPPGTMNFKTEPVLVRVISQTEHRYNPDDLEQFTAAPAAATAQRDTNFKRYPQDGRSQLLQDNCIFIQHCQRDAADLPEPEWLTMISNVARCADGLEKCHELSAGYPGYNPAETAKKIKHVLTMKPLSCSHIRGALGFTGCPDDGCGVKNPASWALAREKREPPEEPKQSYINLDTETLTDLGNANRFARMFRGNLKYCFSFGKWLCWDGTRWEIDDTGRVMAFAKKCIRSMYADAGKIDDKKQRKLLLQHANRCESAAKLRAMIDLTQHMLAVRVDELDTDTWLLNCTNGVLDLRTGRLLQHDPERLLTKLAPVAYDQNAECPLFKKFLHDVFPDPDGINIIPFMQRLIGYTLTGETKEQKMAIAWGNGANGKGTLLNLMQAIMGDYAQTTPTDTLMARRNEGIPNDIARLRGARYVLASESQEGKRLNDALIKQMTGQDRIAARFLRCEFFEFMPQFKIILLTNHKPVTRGDDAALWRRILLIPFTQKFEGSRVDGDMPNKLANEMPGILRWMVDGCLGWQKTGLQAPQEVIAATNAYRNENDVIENWLEENCFIGNTVTAKIGDLYHDFMNWAGENGEKVFITQKKFSQHLQQKGYELFKGGAGVRKIKGISLIDIKHAENTVMDWSEGTSESEKDVPY
jgi:putative DNA primase/helicase